MPPPDNQLYANNFGSGKGRFKTKVYKSFENDVRIWALQKRVQVEIARDMTLQLSARQAFRLDCLFWHCSTDILMKSDGKRSLQNPSPKLKGEPKRNDTFNRVKALSDSLAAILGIDDCWFWAGSVDKLPVKNGVQKVGVDITLSFYHLCDYAYNKSANDSPSSSVKSCD